MTRKDERRLKLMIAFSVLILAIFVGGGRQSQEYVFASWGLVQRPLDRARYEFENAIAVNLASEALEAFRVVRNRNWSLYNHNSLDCWRMLPDVPRDALCEYPHLIESGYYTIERSRNLLGWRFEKQAKPSNVGGGNFDAAALDSYRIRFIGNGIGGLDQKILPTTLVSGLGNGTEFFRVVEVSYLDEKAQSLLVTAKVTWISQTGETHETELSTTFTNHKAFTTPL